MSDAIVTPEMMRRWEEVASVSAETLMKQAGASVAEVALDWIRAELLPRFVTILVGKGNKGGDALVAAALLRKAKVQIEVIYTARLQDSSLLNQTMRRRYKGAILKRWSEASEGLIIDGLLGTGFRGKVSREIAEWIGLANQSGRPILSIDLPSGVDGLTGKVGGIAIHATRTVAIGAIKIGCLLREGWNHTGRITVAPLTIASPTEPLAGAPTFDELVAMLPRIRRSRHKYQAGYLIGLAGSTQYPGAPKLSGLAALRTGCGIVRIFHTGSIGQTPLEVICEPWDKHRFTQEIERAQALFLGPGLGRTKQHKRWLRQILRHLSIPAVIDADALQPEFTFPKGAILTPHRGEMLRLLEIQTDTLEEDFLAKAEVWARKHDLIVVLKGAPTWIFAPHKTPVVIPWGDPGMATAGTGDVLTGMIGALLSQGVQPYPAAVLGASLHAIAGECAALEWGSASMIASDLIAHLGDAFHVLNQSIN
ncbi:MAG: hypothetical protein RL235_1103 [Chlamydiota bacterium]|jgi:NAD(P)H-hydrate epimerase